MSKGEEIERINDESRVAGQNLAKWAESAVRECTETGLADDRCTTCAFRAGTVPNTCIDTLSDAMKCVIDGEVFYCHDKTRKGAPCYGWFAMHASHYEPGKKAPWPFSHEGTAKPMTREQ